MGFNKKHYEECLGKVKMGIASGKTTAYAYMKMYEQSIEKEDYEMAKAITEVLKPLGYDTKDTHEHIKSLQ